MNKQLRISSDLSLPLEAVTQTFAVLAKRGVGKTHLGSVMAEEMLKAGQQIIAIDPTGAWHGLRTSADGKGPGFPVVVFGGEKADLPLDEAAGELIARAAVERRFPAIIDLSLFRKGQSRRFLTAFLETIYRLNREPMHLFVDEADDVCPQRPFGDEAQMVGAMEDVVKRGRKKGIGCTLITQRPADLAKQVLTQCEVLVSLRIVHPRDIGAIKEWVNVHADPVQAAEMIASLPSLPVGDAWFWSPGWGDIFKRVHVRERETFDSGATPKAGQKVPEAKGRAEIDLAALGDQIKVAAEQAKANDPKVMKAELARLRAELEVAKAVKPVPAQERIVEVPVLKNGQLDRTEKFAGRMEEIGAKLLAEAAELRRLILPATARPSPRPVPVRTSPMPMPMPSRSKPVAAAPVEGIDKPCQRIIDALAWWEAIGVRSPTVQQVGAVAQYNPNGGTFSTYLSRLSTHGLVERGSGEVRLTDTGRAAAHHPDSPPSLDDLHARIRGILDSPGVKIIDAVIAAGPNGQLLVSEVGESTGYNPNGGTFSTYLSRLSSLGFIVRGKGIVRPSEVLFPPTLI
jgi:hypothetical protein